MPKVDSFDLKLYRHFFYNDGRVYDDDFVFSA